MERDLDQDYVDVCAFFKNSKIDYDPKACVARELNRLENEMKVARVDAKVDAFKKEFDANENRFSRVTQDFEQRFYGCQNQLDGVFRSSMQGDYIRTRGIMAMLEFYTTDVDVKINNVTAAFQQMSERCRMLKVEWAALQAEYTTIRDEIKQRYMTEKMVYFTKVTDQYHALKSKGQYSGSITKQLAYDMFEKDQPELFVKLQRVISAITVAKVADKPFPLSEDVRKVCKSCGTILRLDLFLRVSDDLCDCCYAKRDRALEKFEARKEREYHEQRYQLYSMSHRMDGQFGPC